MKTLKIAKDLSLPLDLVTQTIAILAKRRSGKSYTMRRISEQLLTAEQQIVVVDPKGDQWGIRSSSDGKKAGFPIIILGGEHGDLPLEVNAGEVVAKLVVEERVSVLLDLSSFRKHEIATFMAIFLENLYRLKAQEKYRTPVMLVVDEADAIAPQKPQRGEERMLGAIEDIVRRGGQRGIGCTLVTQRSAVLNKNVLTQAQMLVVLRTIAPQDLAAMKAWIDVHGEPDQAKTLMESLPSLPIGDAWFWSPGWPTNEGIFHRTHVLPIETFDSGATPKPGERKVIPKTAADVDLAALEKQMAATIEKAKADDPRELKKKIVELEKQVDKKSNIVRNMVADPDVVDKAVQKAIAKRDAEWKVEVVNAHKEVSRLAKILGQVARLVGTDIVTASEPVPIKLPAIEEKKESPEFPVIMTEEGRSFSKGARLILTYLHSVHPQWKSKAQIWVATGYAPSGSFNNMLYELTGAGLVSTDGRGKYTSSEQHNQSMIDETFSPDLEKWDQKLSAASRKIFQILKNNPETTYSKESLASLTGYALSGSFNNSIYELTGKELVIKQGTEYIINPEVLDL